ncbi:ECF transporter S component [Caproiciproducens sp. NJN-50]|uniref:ECF transporter S component n=1 Tax=Acutalibacteraceae TaxID=3082771 RepID=UPI000FFE03A6|nr:MULTISPECIES: ECF transporter S component [Acutalibacteraceae]QAT49645.1 ECF transporter S component [Caproiciproducens sp. NJN-50]
MTNNYEKAGKRQRLKFDARNIAQIGVLSGIAFLLMMFEFPLWFAPAFYRLDFSELPVLIGGFALGPVAGIMIELVKVILYLVIHGSSTAGVGDLANFLIGCSLVVPSAILYKYHKSRRNAVIGLVLGTLVMILVGSLVNAYVLLPVYAVAYHMPMSALISMGSVVNPSIKNLQTFILLAVAPFNLFKGVTVSCLTMLLYKRVSPILHHTMGK